MSTLHEDLRTFMKTSPLALLRMRNGSNKQRKSKHNFMFNILFSENSRRLWNNVEKYGTVRRDKFTI
jgi:hypothetical protein